MFSPDKPIFVTSTIAEELPAEHRQFIHQYIEDNHELMTDNLQVFTFYEEHGQQFLSQRQENLERNTTLFVALKNDQPINLTLYMRSQVEKGTIIMYLDD
ncbi:DUF960 family protein [Sporosarcina ureae]|uniref:DUF960 family protein n=1 Tax=Sporosarcina ureae TaxID=1571 RepID=UPI000A17DED9|nr:DUF960 family protein [Sporosarcina ureae]ARK22269.1 hypothetical protein SporoP32a_12470 [Sporosarcina ureae]